MLSTYLQFKFMFAKYVTRQASHSNLAHYVCRVNHISSRLMHHKSVTFCYPNLLQLIIESSYNGLGAHHTVVFLNCSIN